MDDAALVLAVRQGDRDALATVYDRYADRLHDFCWSVLRDRDEAADAVHDTFLLAAQRIAQLRDPDKLRPWLYAIARSQCLRRTRARGRERPVADVVDTPAPGEGDLNMTLRAEEARELVWAAAGGLAQRDRALLDLHLRHGLEGQELGDAMGVAPAHAYVLLSRVRDQVERSIGALLVARQGRADCDDLQKLLQGWDGRFTPLWRKRVARHVDGCETCDGRRRALASPLALLAAMPLVPAPSDLRDRVLGDIDLTSSAREPWPDDGFPPPSGSGRSSRRPLAAAAITVAVLVAVLGLWLAGSDPTAPLVAAGDGGAVASATTSPAQPFTASPADGPSPVPAGVATIVPPSVTLATPGPAGPAGPRLDLAGARLDFGDTGTERRFQLANAGDAPLSWSAASESAHFSVEPGSGSLDPGRRTDVTVRVDRSSAPEGDLAGRVQVTSDGGTGSAELAATVGRPPRFDRLSADPPRLGTSGCGARVATVATVTAVVSDESTVASARLHWTDASGTTGSGDMLADGGRFTARLGPFPGGGSVTWHVEAADTLGNRGRSGDQTVVVTPCAQ